MRGPTSLLLIAAAAIAGWFFFSDYPLPLSPNNRSIVQQTQPYANSSAAPYGQPPMPSASPGVALSLIHI